MTPQIREGMGPYARFRGLCGRRGELGLTEKYGAERLVGQRVAPGGSERKWGRDRKILQIGGGGFPIPWVSQGTAAVAEDKERSSAVPSHTGRVIVRRQAKAQAQTAPPGP